MAKYLDGTGLGILWSKIGETYLPLSGGTLTSTSGTVLNINSTATGGATNVLFKSNGTGKAQVGYSTASGAYIKNVTAGKELGISDSGALKYDGNVVITSSNFYDYGTDLLRVYKSLTNNNSLSAVSSSTKIALSHIPTDSRLSYVDPGAGVSVTVEDTTGTTGIVLWGAESAGNVALSVNGASKVLVKKEAVDGLYSSIGTLASYFSSGSAYNSLALEGHNASYFSPATHTHDLEIATTTDNNQITLAYGGKYKLREGGSEFVFTMPGGDDTNTTYTFASGTTKGAFKVTPSNGSAQTVEIYGLKSAAFTESSAYATSDHNHSIENLTNFSSRVYDASTARAKNTVLAGPSSGSSGAASFRALVAADIPSLGWSKITSGKPSTLEGYGITDAALATHTHDISIVAGGGNDTNQLTLAYGTKYKLTAGGKSFIFTTQSSDNTNTTYTFASGTTKGAFSVTPSGGSAQSVSIYGLGSAAYTESSAYSAADHKHDISIATTTDGNQLNIARGTKYKITAGGKSFVFTTPASDNTNTTYTFASGTTKGAFSVTPSGGSAQVVSIYGLGSAAYTNSSAYAESGHNHNIEDLVNFGTRVYDATTTRTKNTFLGAPDGSNGVGTFRALVAADIPSLPWSKIGSGKPTTLSGYGITDAKVENGLITLGSGTIRPLVSASKGTSVSGGAVSYNNGAVTIQFPTLITTARGLTDGNDLSYVNTSSGVDVTVEDTTGTTGIVLWGAESTNHIALSVNGASKVIAKKEAIDSLESSIGVLSGYFASGSAYNSLALNGHGGDYYMAREDTITNTEIDTIIV